MAVHPAIETPAGRRQKSAVWELSAQRKMPVLRTYVLVLRSTYVVVRCSRLGWLETRTGMLTLLPQPLALNRAGHEAGAFDFNLRRRFSDKLPTGGYLHRHWSARSRWPWASCEVAERRE